MNLFVARPTRALYLCAILSVVLFQILVWHTHTKDVTASNSRIRTKLKKYGTSSNLNALLKQAYFVSGGKLKGRQGQAVAAEPVAAEPDDPQPTPAVDT